MRETSGTGARTIGPDQAQKKGGRELCALVRFMDGFMIDPQFPNIPKIIPEYRK